MRRRTFLSQVTAAAATCAVPMVATAAKPLATRMIDTHTHFYDPTRAAGVPWPGKGTSLYRPVYPQDFLAVAKPHGVRETVVVEASAWLEDNQWILDLAAKEKSIVGFVGNLAPQTEDFAKQVKRFAANPLFRGIRPNGDSFKHFDTPEFKRGLTILSDANLSLDINVPQGYALAAQIAKEYPQLRIILNHVGSAGDASKLTEAWRKGLQSLREYKQVYCKISALIEQSELSNMKYGTAPRETTYYHPILDHCWNCFGPERLLYGSNWPVCEKGGSYADQFQIVHDYFGEKGPEVCEQFFWKNSRAAYVWIER
jgi:predicted TIM-barrel fold metal-dependent hydrolase